MMALSQEEDDSVSASERYDLKAYQFNQYFPQAKNEKSKEQWLEEKREELGLNSTKDRKRYSMQDEDAEPRYEISKLSRMAKKDLDATNHDNLNEQERTYGDGKSIGDDILEQNRSSSLMENGGKQLDGRQMSQYLKFTTDRDQNLTPLEDGIRQFNSGNLLKPDGYSMPKQPVMGTENSTSLLPGLAGLNQSNNEYTSMLSALHQKRNSQNALAVHRSHRMNEQ